MSKMKDVVLTIFLVLLGTAVFSQTGQTGSIKGKIIDAKTKEALEFVNVSIRTKDSGKTLVTGTVTDSTGVFHLSRIKNGTYILSASYIGYRTLEKEFTISSKERNINLRNLLLEEDAQAISEVQVVAQRAQMRFEIDKKVFTWPLTSLKREDRQVIFSAIFPPWKWTTRGKSPCGVIPA